MRIKLGLMFFVFIIACSSPDSFLSDLNFILLGDNQKEINKIRKGDACFLLVSVDYKAPRNYLPTLVKGDIANDSLLYITFSLKKDRRLIKVINKYVSISNDSLLNKYGELSCLNLHKFASFEDFRKQYNLAASGKEEFNSADMGRCGMKLDFKMPLNDTLNGKFYMRLEFGFSSGKRVFKEREITILGSV
jgi:hypothetical protein